MSIGVNFGFLGMGSPRVLVQLECSFPSLSETVVECIWSVGKLMLAHNQIKY